MLASGAQRQAVVLGGASVALSPTCRMVTPGDMGLEGHVGMTGGLAPQSLGGTLPRPLSPQDLPTHP